MKSSTPRAREPRLAKNYRLVHDVLLAQAHGSHLCVADVFALARQRQPRIGFTTVYRALGRLRSMGLVAEVLLPGMESAHYEVSGVPHAHFRCTSCGQVEDVDYVLPGGVVAELAAGHDVEVADVLVSLQGRCARCKES